MLSPSPIYVVRSNGSLINTDVVTETYAIAFPNLSRNLVDWNDLVTSTAGLSDDALQLVDLLLGTTEGTELEIRESV